MVSAIPPEAWENATPVYGIRTPKPTAPAKNLPTGFNHIAADLEAALLTIPSVPGLNFKTGTAAERAAATPTRDEVWIETDTGKYYIGTGSAWIPLANQSATPWQDRPATAGTWNVYGRPGGFRQVGTTVEVRGQTLGRVSAAVFNPGQGASINDGTFYPKPFGGYTIRAVGIICASSNRGVTSVEIDGTGKLTVGSLLNSAQTMNATTSHSWSDCLVLPNFTYEAAA